MCAIRSRSDYNNINNNLYKLQLYSLYKQKYQTKCRIVRLELIGSSFKLNYLYYPLDYL